MFARLLIAVTLVVGLSTIATPGFGAEPERDDPTETAVGIAGYGGVGLPEFFHGELGFFLHPRFLLEAQYKNVGFTHMTGLGATGYLFGEAEARRPGQNSLVVSLGALVNPTLGELRIRSRGDTLSSLFTTHVGWGLIDPNTNISLRVLVGGLFAWEGKITGGPAVHIGVGYIL